MKRSVQTFARQIQNHCDKFELEKFNIILHDAKISHLYQSQITVKVLPDILSTLRIDKHLICTNNFSILVYLHVHIIIYSPLLLHHSFVFKIPTTFVVHLINAT